MEKISSFVPGVSSVTAVLGIVGGAASLWDEVTVDPVTGYDEWQQPTGAQDAYNKGDRVVYKGSVYESAIDGNSWSPEAYPAGWTLVS